MSGDDEDSIGALIESTGKSASEIRKFGEFVDSLFGNALSNSFGLIADKLAYYRLEKAILLAEKTKQKLDARGVSVARYIPMNIGLPLLEKASLEEDAELNERWSNLLANAMDPSFSYDLKKSFVSILGELEALDARVLELVVSQGLASDQLFDQEKIATAMNIGVDQCDMALRNLFRLGLIKPGVIQASGIRVGSETPSTYKDLELFAVTNTGRTFYAAVS